MSKNSPYLNFQNFVLRTPLFSFSGYKKLTSKNEVLDSDLKAFCNHKIFQEAIFLASPSLLSQLHKWLKDEDMDEKSVEKLKISTLKYISRMSSRCTPFGLFAGCAVGNYGENTRIELKEIDENERHTRLDMNYLVALSKNLVKIKNIRNQIRFYPNTSIYEVGNQIRYIEYFYIKARRVHQVSGVDSNKYLKKIIAKAKKGSKLETLLRVLQEEGINKIEGSMFINDLIDNQILVSELEPSVSGPEFLNQLIDTLEKLEDIEDILYLLRKIENSLNCLDNTIGNNPKKYFELCKTIEKLETDFDIKLLFQTDLVVKPHHNILKKKSICELQKGFAILNKITLPPKTTTLIRFKEEFRKRYNTREVPLSNVLDVELGIGYLPNQGISSDISPLVDDIVVPRKMTGNESLEVNWGSINTYFQKRLMEAYKNGDFKIILSDEDFDKYETRWDDLPDTISFMVEIVIINGKEKIRYKGGGGSSAANLLARFCHGDDDMFSLTKQIIDNETNSNSNKILAEIIHLPESRIGNVIMKPDFRKYEIPYLAKSIKPLKNQIQLDDLVVSIRPDGRIILKSKKHGKEIVPRLTNAHNYSKKPLPVYQFLANLQNQHKRNGVGLNLGPFANEYEFIPRIEYQNLILHVATWNLNNNHIKDLIEHSGDIKILLQMTKSFREIWKIPKFAMLVEGDNELVINFENATSIKMFLDTVYKKEKFKLTEFLFCDDGIVKKGQEYFTNQLIIPFYKKENNF